MGLDRDSDREIAGVTADSRAVKPGYLFAALPGSKVDGARFAAQAVRSGAVAILAARDAMLEGVPDGIVVLRQDEPRRTLARIAVVFAGPQPSTVVAVTGTNGKTSTADFARQIWTSLGQPAASVGTLGIVSPALNRPPGLTTPDPVALHADLARLKRAGVERVAMEASSHGLDQFRLDGVSLRAAAFTNLTHEHLDYHATMDAYFAAKTRLFTDLLARDGTAVINADSDRAAALSGICGRRGVRVWTYGLQGRELKLEQARPSARGQSLTLSLFGRSHTIELPLIGDFMAANALAALGLVVAAGEDADRAVATLTGLRGAPGRLELVGRARSGAAVYVDYAHKPDALEIVLRTMRPFTRGRLIVVFGCGGDRDRAKRPIMGGIAARLADDVFVTDDNPRGEVPADIRREIMRGVPAGAGHVREVSDGRRAAITAALDAARSADDLVVVAGKGHERGQTIGDVTHPFDDAEVVRELLGGRAEGAAA
ncbi:MAG: UDP-N-acetylmuramoyl-L-alanyl-D-glutamate--2,6-diaminopimelate ligase [Alphaproteobacteria bacterium]|nr:UDP-N-acetylmuramoyl-L-alanyl-D-glutamate--2,6-diaminopimelate ligase [Alphaproteobacteria bacterium]MCW5742300.1 UDP-N-acetylmuramoyl-L-alanyl-D-glutamate--2,6-diaminopimelate ligase [Alphaproteobacteria bacterium]